MGIGEGEAGLATLAIDTNLGDNDEGLIAQIEGEINESNSSAPRKNDTSQNGLSIYRCPEGFNKLDGKYLKPQVVAIGPYHRLNPKLQMMEGVKRECVHYLLRNDEKNYLRKCLEQIRPLEGQLQKCYSSPETIKLSTDEFLKMMVVDGCFIIDLFLNFTRECESDHPLYRLLKQERVVVSKIYWDLLLLENQIPSIVLKKLFPIFNDRGIEFLANMVTKVFNRSMMITEYPVNRYKPPSEWLHLLDLVRLLFIPGCHNEIIDYPFNRYRTPSGWLHLPDLVRSLFNPRGHNERQDRWTFAIFSPTPCVTKLHRAGIKIKGEMLDSFLDVKFKGGVIEMPYIALDHEMCSFLVNCVAFEQFHRRSTHFSIYATFLDGLVNTDKDIEYLCDHRVIANSFGTDAEAAVFINNLGKDLTVYNDYDNNPPYLFEFFLDVNRYYYRKRMHWGKWKWTSFKQEYFGKPWMLISAFVAFVLLTLTFLQTYYTIYAYLHPKN